MEEGADTAAIASLVAHAKEEDGTLADRTAERRLAVGAASGLKVIDSLNLSIGWINI